MPFSILNISPLVLLTLTLIILILILCIFSQTLHKSLNTLLTTLIKQSPLPNHIAFIMDGNRRYAKHQNKNELQGHETGYTALEDVLKTCLGIGIGQVSVYAFRYNILLKILIMVCWINTL